PDPSDPSGTSGGSNPQDGSNSQGPSGGSNSSGPSGPWGSSGPSAPSGPSRPCRAAPPSRTHIAVVLDAALTAGCGLAAAVAVIAADLLGPELPFWRTALGTALAVSFGNHVLLTRLTGASLGKLATGLRMVRDTDAGRPGVSALTRRWLFGFCWTVLFALRAAGEHTLDREDAVGIRTVRRPAPVAPAARAASSPSHALPCPGAACPCRA
ncbi:RDD family protein, partial [Streptomyces sp. NPDC058461]